LIVPKKEIFDLQSIAKEDLPLIGEIVEVAQTLAKRFEITEGYRLLTNNGAAAGQTVFHLHFHLIGGRKLGALA
jgi:histidine triad (HIT) family protein